MFINPAFAQDAMAIGGSLSGTLLQLGAIFAIFYFLLIRPQQKRIKAHDLMLQAIKKNDHVITGGGLYGKVIEVIENDLSVEIAPNVVVKTPRASIRDVVVAENKNIAKEAKIEKTAKKVANTNKKAKK